MSCQTSNLQKCAEDFVQMQGVRRELSMRSKYLRQLVGVDHLSDGRATPQLGKSSATHLSNSSEASKLLD